MLTPGRLGLIVLLSVGTVGCGEKVHPDRGGPRLGEG